MVSGRSKILLVLLAAVFIVPCAGHAVSTQGADDCPSRIVSLGPPQTEELFLLGCGDKVVGVTSYCIRPPGAQRKEKVGSVKEVSLEKIVGLKPDLVIATSLTDPNAIEKLCDLEIKVAIISQPEDFNQLCRQFMDLGDIVGKKAKARELVCKAQDRMCNLKTKIAGLPRARVFIQVGAKPLVTAGAGSFISSLVELAGGVNIAENSEERSYVPYSREKVIGADPDCIIIVSMGSIAGEEEKRVWESFKNLKAVKDGRIYVVDAYKFCSPTLATVVEAFKDIAVILHPGIRLE